MINILKTYLFFILFYDFSIYIIWYRNFHLHNTRLVKMQILSFSLLSL